MKVLHIIKPMISIALVINLILSTIIWWYIYHHTNISYPMMALISVVYLIVYAISLVQFGWLQDQEKSYIIGLISKLGKTNTGFVQKIIYWLTG